MLDYNILSNKAPITLIKNGEEHYCMDLLSKTYELPANITGQYIVVTEEYIARPDLISQAIYGNDKYADILCKFNGFSNPFELNKNMIVFCPTVDYLSKYSSGLASKSDLVVNNASVSSNINSNGTSSLNLLNKLTNTDEATLSKTESTLQKKLNERRSPGDQTVNDKNYILDKSLGIVIY